MAGEPRDRVVRGEVRPINQSVAGRSRVNKLKSSNKSFAISKQEVWDAWTKVKENKGAPGVDEQSLQAFEADVKGNLYKIWNRMSSGTYFPPPVKGVEIEKPHGGGTRLLGIPTVGDRVAQTVVASHLQQRLEPVFHPDSYGYRPGKSALDAVAVCRRRCWKYDWVVEFDIRKFFDSVPWALITKAVRAHTDARWVMLYVERWLAAPISMPGGELQTRDRGTPQGSAVSPVLANLFMHYAFDRWLSEQFPAVAFERYADDAVVHCASQAQAERVLTALHQRMAEVGLELHSGKTNIVYCKDSNRRGQYANTSFTFLGYTFRPRCARRKDGGQFTSFLPAVSNEALKKMSARVRSWRLHRRVNSTGAELASMINSVVRGWMAYYGAFYHSALHPLLHRINTYLLRWIMHKYRRLNTWKKSIQAMRDAIERDPQYFAHWSWAKPAVR
jgi:RNA-directed DNA polymerase